jgi:hypothetical protein
VLWTHWWSIIYSYVLSKPYFVIGTDSIEFCLIEEKNEFSL